MSGYDVFIHRKKYPRSDNRYQIYYIVSLNNIKMQYFIRISSYKVRIPVEHNADINFNVKVNIKYYTIIYM